MQLETEKLLAALEVIIKGLLSSFQRITSEGGYLFQAFVCEAVDKDTSLLLSDFERLISSDL